MLSVLPPSEFNLEVFNDSEDSGRKRAVIVTGEQARALEAQQVGRPQGDVGGKHLCSPSNLPLRGGFGLGYKAGVNRALRSP
jgi:hypothetical protein